MTGGFAEVERNLEKLQEDVFRKLFDAGDEIGDLLANYAKTNHKWGNPYSKGYEPTGATDVSTQGGVYHATREFVEVVLSAGMTYNVFLELAMQGRWAWLMPAVEANQREIMSILERHLAL